MKNRLILVINPRSSGFSLIKSKILPFLEEAHFKENQLTTFEIQPTSPMENAAEMAKGIQDGDMILVAGGDGTAHIATNAAVFSGKKNLKIKYTGFGNFNDYAHSFSKNSGKAAIEAFKNKKPVAKIRPLEIKINGELFRYAPLYATVGLTAEMAEIFEGKRLRKALRKVHGRNRRLILSLIAATRFYFKFRKKHNFEVANIWLNDKKLANFTTPATDLVFMNGPRMARIMRSSKNKKDALHFGFNILNSAHIFRNLPFLILGFLGKIPLKSAQSVKIEFKRTRKITIQIEGEVAKIPSVKTLEVKVGDSEISIL